MGNIVPMKAVDNFRQSYGKVQEHIQGNGHLKEFTQGDAAEILHDDRPAVLNMDNIQKIDNAFDIEPADKVILVFESGDFRVPGRFGFHDLDDNRCIRLIVPGPVYLGKMRLVQALENSIAGYHHCVITIYGCLFDCHNTG